MKESPLLDPDEEKREYFRLYVTLPADYQLEGEGVRFAPQPITLNLSGGGIGFATQRRFNLGDRIVLTIMLPSHPAITAKAEIVRVAPREKDKATFSIGARFTALSKKDQERILKYLINVQRERLRDHYTT